jgi:hypothetical protein
VFDKWEEIFMTPDEKRVNKFNVGELVTVKSHVDILDNNAQHGGESSEGINFNDEEDDGGMTRHCGKTYVVTKYGKRAYELTIVAGGLEDGVEQWWWSEEWLLPAFRPVLLEDNLFED